MSNYVKNNNTLNNADLLYMFLNSLYKQAFDLLLNSEETEEELPKEKYQKPETKVTETAPQTTFTEIDKSVEEAPDGKIEYAFYEDVADNEKSYEKLQGRVMEILNDFIFKIRTGKLNKVAYTVNITFNGSNGFEESAYFIWNYDKDRFEGVVPGIEENVYYSEIEGKFSRIIPTANRQKHAENKECSKECSCEKEVEDMPIDICDHSTIAQQIYKKLNDDFSAQKEYQKKNILEAVYRIIEYESYSPVHSIDYSKYYAISFSIEDIINHAPNRLTVEMIRELFATSELCDIIEEHFGFKDVTLTDRGNFICRLIDE